MQAMREDLPLASPPLRRSAKLAYGLGDFGFGLSWNMVGAFLLFFYTDVALLRRRRSARCCWCRDWPMPRSIR